MKVLDSSTRRRWLRQATAALAAAGAGAAAQGRSSLQRVGVVSLLGNSVRVVARETQEVLFKDVGMDAVVFDAAGSAVNRLHPQAEIRRFSAPAEVDVKDQLDIGLAASRRSELPAWVLASARQESLSHVLLVGCSTGAMEFRTGMTQVVGNDQVTGIGFFVSASGRTKNLDTGAVGSGYLAPFVQLRISLLDMDGPKLLHTTNLSEGYIVGAPVAEAPDPWQFLNRADKASALASLLQRATTRGTQEVLDKM